MESPGTILLVDDDEAVRRLLQRVFKENGFHVIEAADGAQALEVASAFSQRIDLLLTDVIMPKLNGTALAERLLSERPGLKLLFISGYVERQLLLSKYPASVLLQKPFRP